MLLVNRGVLRVRTDRIDDAIADLKAAIKLKPNAYQAFVNLAQAYRRLDKLDLALEQLHRAAELEPGLAHLYRLQARLHLERNEPDLALTYFDRAIEREDANSPYLVDDHVERGRLLLRGGKHAEALASFDAALALRKDDPQAQRLRAEALFRLGRFEEVVEAFDRYLETGKPLEVGLSRPGPGPGRAGPVPGGDRGFHQGAGAAPDLGRAGVPRLDVPGRRRARSWPCATSSWRSSSTPGTATRTAAGALSTPSRAVIARRSAMPRRPSASGRRRRACSTMPRESMPSAPARSPSRALELIRQALSCFPTTAVAILVQEHPEGRGPGRAPRPSVVHPARTRPPGGE